MWNVVPMPRDEVHQICPPKLTTLLRHMVSPSPCAGMEEVD